MVSSDGACVNAHTIKNTIAPIIELTINGWKPKANSLNLNVINIIRTTVTTTEHRAASFVLFFIIRSE